MRTAPSDATALTREEAVAALRPLGWRERLILARGRRPLHSLTQDRLREFQRLLGGTHVGLGLLAFVVSRISIPGQAPHRTLLAGVINIGIGVALGVVALVLHRRRLDGSALALVDGITTVNASAAVVLTAAITHLGMAGNVAGMVLTITLMLRVAMVPSPPRQTLAVGLSSAGASLLAVWLVAKLEHPDSASGAPGGYIAFAVYALLIVLVTRKAAAVIHGLHASVEEASRHLGQYALLEKVGEGAMGSVWRARHAMLKRITAVKVMHDDRTSASDIRRFEREVQLTSRLSHPNTVAVFDYGQADDGRLYYVMEYVDGLSLEQLVDRHGPQPAARVVHLLRQLVDALAEAHALGLIHRDVKPANVLVSERGGVTDFVKVVDFGLVKALAPEHHLGRSNRASETNLIAGTPEYLAPESILRPDDVDARVDIYAVGVLAFFLLTSRTVFEGSNLVEICSHHVHSEPSPPSASAADVPPTLDALILRCLAKDPAARPTALALRTELAVLAAELPWTHPPALAAPGSAS